MKEKTQEPKNINLALESMNMRRVFQKIYQIIGEPLFPPDCSF